VSLFGAVCKAVGLPAPVIEFRFAPPRRFAFDFAWEAQRVAVEQEGGLFGRGKRCPLCGRKAVGAHTSIERLKSDLEKYNLAAAMGWRVGRFTPEQLNDGRALAWLERLLK
jgi:hypothetical protein